MRFFIGSSSVPHKVQISRVDLKLLGQAEIKCARHSGLGGWQDRVRLRPIPTSERWIRWTPVPEPRPHRSSGSKVRYSTPQRRESGIDYPHTPISLNDCGRKMTKRDMCAGKVSLVDRNWFSRLLHVSVRAPAVTSICPQLSFSFSLFRERNLCEDLLQISS